MSWISLLLALATIQNTPSDAVNTAIAEGDRLLQEAGATDLFTNESAKGEGAILLRHKASGYRCVINPGKEENVVRIYPNAERGNDVSCTTRTITDARTTYFTRHTASAEEFAEGGAIAIQARYRNAREVKVANDPMEMGITDIELPTPLSRGFETRDSYEQVTVGKQGDWVVKMRFSSAPGRSGMGGLFVNSWTMTVLEPRIKEIQKARSQPAIDPAPVAVPH